MGAERVSAMRALPSPAATRGKGARWQFAVVWVVAAGAAFLGIRRLHSFDYAPNWFAAWRGIRPLLPLTGLTAVKVWAFWVWGMLALAGVALKCDPSLEVADALLAGASGLWVVAFVAGNLLGPLGLFREATVWLALLGLSAWLLWTRPPISPKPLSPGQKLAMLAWAALALSMLPMQLGATFPAYMDVLSYPASAQRIVTFHTYNPFDNNPNGLFGAYAQTPALELFYAMLALGSHTTRATLAETAAMVPMAGLLIFGTWRLGKTLFGDTAGGMAALLLFFTDLFRRLQGMRGTAVDFALVAIGLAFFLDTRRSRALMVAGSLVLGTAVASHGIDGASAMLLASFGALLWLVSGDFARFRVGAACLAGAALIGSPEIPIALARPLPFPILPALQLAGVALVIFAVRRLAPGASALRALATKSLGIGASALMLLTILLRGRVALFSVYTIVATNQPFLLFLCCIGLIGVAIISIRAPQSLPYGGIAGVALLFGVAGNGINPFLTDLGSSLSAFMMSSDVLIKLYDYWCPYFLLMLAAFPFAIFYDEESAPLALLAVLLTVVYPWRADPNAGDADSAQHGIVEQWGINLRTAAYGYFQGCRDTRWTMDSSGLALVKTLDREVGAGRITMDTHVLDLTDSIDWCSLLQFPVLTGINADIVEYRDDRNNAWVAGGRVHFITDLSAELAKRPPYILEQWSRAMWPRGSPDGYRRIFGAGRLRLYRREDL